MGKSFELSNHHGKEVFIYERADPIPILSYSVSTQCAVTCSPGLAAELEAYRAHSLTRSSLEELRELERRDRSRGQMLNAVDNEK